LQTTEENINQAVSVLQQGGIIAYPTEAVFGLGCDPQRDNSIKRLLQVKQRPASKGLILIASEIVQLTPYIDTARLDAARWQQVQASWPGPYTWLLPVRRGLSKLIRGEHSSVAVRVSAHPIVRQLCDSFGGAIISTSANRSGMSPAVTVDEVEAQLGELIDYVVAGDVGGSDKPTEIRDALSGKIIRPA
jgi:L-threonylcarbamoyladenylate synthase